MTIVRRVSIVGVEHLVKIESGGRKLFTLVGARDIIYAKWPLLIADDLSQSDGTTPRWGMRSAEQGRLEVVGCVLSPVRGEHRSDGGGIVGLFLCLGLAVEAVEPEEAQAEA